MSLFQTFITSNSFIKIYPLEDLSNDVYDQYARFDFHQVIWITASGKDRSLSVDFLDFELSAEQAIVIYPEQIVKIDLRDKKGYLLLIHNDIFFQINQKIGSDYLNGYFMNQLVTIDSQSRQSMTTLIDLMLGVHAIENRQGLLESYLCSILYIISYLFDEHASQKEYVDYPLFVKVIRLIDLHFIAEKETAFYTQQFAVSAKKLNKICKTITNKNIKELIQERIVLEIRKELQLGKKNIKEIAYDLGFNEPSYMTRFFKKQTGLTPKAFSSL